MALYNDLISASELTVFARRTQQDINAQSVSLAQFFPDTLTDSDVAKYTITDGGLVAAAEYRSFDAESTIGNARGGRNVAIQLPAVSQKNRVGELDQIRARSGNEQAELKIAQVTVDTTNAVLSRIEAMRGTVLETGRVTINENGFYADEDLGRKESLTTQAANQWDDTAGTPLDDLIAWAEVYEDENGALPGAILASNKVISAFQRSEQVRNAVGGLAARNVVSLEELNALLGSYGLPGFTRFGRKVNIAGTTQNIVSPDKVFFLPAPGTNELGQTVYGTTAEANAPEYAIAAPEAPGLIAGVNREFDPYAYWVRVNALALPVMTNPNASMVAKVLNFAG
ncbi:major capsid protein [Corynebacterium sp. ZY180755]